MKYLEELGKGLINFANIGTVLIFLRVYVEESNFQYLIAGFVFFISLYIIGLTAIHKSEGEKQ